MTRLLKTLKDAEQYLLRYSPEKQAGEAYKLDRMRVLMGRLGNPQNDIPAIHVAGTSGKTSTSYFIRALLEAHGKKTGLTASPHIDSITERVQVGGAPLDEGKFLAYLNEFLQIIAEWEDLLPTYFELLVAFAFWVFKQEAVDYMVVEVGLGGLLDATNVIDDSSKVSVITPIGLDHTEVLGKTVEVIAYQKAGVIAQGSHVFSGQQEPAALGVIKEVCRVKDSQLDMVTVNFDETSDSPLFQQANYQLAYRVVSYLAQRDGLESISKELEVSCMTKTPPGRFEVYEISGKTVILDGAHNPQKLAMLVRSLRQRYPDESFAWLVGFISAPNQKIETCVQEIAKPADEYIFTDFTVGQDIKGRSSANSSELVRLMIKEGGQAIAEPDLGEALDRVMASKKRTIVITGSLYLVAKLHARIKSLAD